MIVVVVTIVPHMLSTAVVVVIATPPQVELVVLQTIGPTHVEEMKNAGEVVTLTSVEETRGSLLRM